MSQRTTNLLWLKDLLEHLMVCQQQLEWTEDPEAMAVLLASMQRDLEHCQRVCETLGKRLPARRPAC